MANDTHGIGGKPPPAGFPPANPPAGERKAARPRAARPTGGNAAAAAGTGKAAPGVRPQQAQGPESAQQANKRSQLASSQKAFAATQAQDGLDAQGASNKAGASHGRPNAARNSDAQLQQVATQPTLDPLVLPPPLVPAMSAVAATQFLSRLSAVSAPVAALRTASTSAPASSSDAQAAATSTDAPPDPPPTRFTPAMLRLVKNELHLSPRAYKALVALNDSPQGLVGASAAAATKATLVATVPATATATAPSPADKAVTVQSVDGTPVTMAANDAYDLKYHGYMSWTAFSSLLTRDQLEAMQSLALLRQIDIGWQDKNQQVATELDLLRTQNVIEGETFQKKMDLFGSAIRVKEAYIQGQSNILRNKNPNLSFTENELGMRLETNTGAAKNRSDMLQLADELARAQKAARGGHAAGEQTPPQAHDILDFVPAVPAAGGEPATPAYRLKRTELTEVEERGFVGPAKTAYEAQKASLRRSEEMDISSKWARLSDQAAQLDQAAKQSLRAAAASTDPASQSRYAALAKGFELRAQQLRQRADGLGFDKAILSANRANKMQFHMDIRAQQRELGELLAKKREWASTPGRRTDSQNRLLDVSIENAQFRIIGMHKAVATTDNLEVHANLALRPSGHESLVKRYEELAGKVRQSAAQPGPAHYAAVEELRTFDAHNTADVVNANALSDFFHTAAASNEPNIQEQVATLGSVSSSKAAKDAAQTTLMDLLKNRFAAAGQPNYQKLLHQVNKLRMDKHVRQRSGWDNKSEQAQTVMRAEGYFWRHHNELQPSAANLNSFWSRARLNLTPALNPPRQEPRANAQGPQDPQFDPVARFASGAGVNLLDPAARDQHIQAQIKDAQTWTDGYKDNAYDRLTLLSTIATQGHQAIGSISSDMGRLAEGALEEFSGMVDESRSEFYAALAQEQNATLGLVQQLMSLMRLSG